MKISALDEYMKIKFARCLIANELGGSLSLVYRFSDPDGVRSGKSGWSFGVCQYDIANNKNAALCLAEAGFTLDEIQGLRLQVFDDMEPLNAKLLSHKETVDKYDARQIKECLDVTMQYCGEIGTDFSSIETVLHLADFHNQLHIDKGGAIYNWLKSNVAQPITPEMIREYKLYNTAWGRVRPDDVNRRFDNIMKIYQEGKAA